MGQCARQCLRDIVHVLVVREQAVVEEHCRQGSVVWSLDDWGVWGRLARAEMISHAYRASMVGGRMNYFLRSVEGILVHRCCGEGEERGRFC